MKADEIFTKYPNQYTKKDVKAARDWLEKVKERTSNGVFASFKNGKLAQERLNGPCHGGIVGVAPFGPLVASLTKGPTNPGYDGASLVKSDPALAERWFTWLLYDTYWSPFYVETTVEEAMHSGLLVPSTLPANLMQGCNIITRHNHEHVDRIRAWSQLIDAGMEPDIAYLCVFCLGLYAEGFKNNVPIPLTAPGHNAMGPLLPSVLKNFLNRDYNNLLEPLYEKKGGSYGLSSVIPTNPKQPINLFYGYYSSAPAPPKYIADLVKFFASLEGKKETAEVVSPFARRSLTGPPKVAGVEVPGMKIILKNAKVVQEWLLKEYKENG